MTITSCAKLDCEAVERNPLEFHHNDWLACSRSILAIGDYEELRETALRLDADLPVDQIGVRGPQLQSLVENWSLAKTSRSMSFSLLDPGGYGHIGIGFELSKSARILSFMHCRSSSDMIIMAPPWAKDFRDWIESIGELDLVFVADLSGYPVGSADSEREQGGIDQLLDYAEARGYDALIFKRHQGFILNPAAIESAFIIRRWVKKHQFAYLVEKAIKQGQPVSDAAILSSRRRDLTVEVGMNIDMAPEQRRFFWPYASRYHRQAERYMLFVEQSAGLIRGETDLRGRLERARDVVLGLQRYIAIGAALLYALGGTKRWPDIGRSLEMGARMMDLPGAGMTGRHIPEQYAGFPEDLVELALEQADASRKGLLKYDLEEGVQLLRRAHGSFTGRVVSNEIEQFIARVKLAVVGILMSGDIGWARGATTFEHRCWIV